MKNKTFTLKKTAIATMLLAGTAVGVQAEENAAKATLDMNLRYENVDDKWMPCDTTMYLEVSIFMAYFFNVFFALFRISF